jgi:hypothetical protein
MRSLDRKIFCDVKVARVEHLDAQGHATVLQVVLGIDDDVRRQQQGRKVLPICLLQKLSTRPARRIRVHDGLLIPLSHAVLDSRSAPRPRRC